MIYLFSSAYRPLYAIDILSVLALPAGASVVHRYRVRGGEYQHVHSKLVTGLAGGRGVQRVRHMEDRLVRTLGELRRVGLPAPEPAAVLLLFVDRDDSYKYYPLRWSHLVASWERDNRLYFRVQLGDFVASHPKQVSAVSDRIKFSLGGEGPHAPSGPAYPTRDGCYAVLAQDAVTGHADVVSGEDAWNAAVDSLGSTRTFESTDERPVVFVRTGLERRGGRGDERPTRSGSLERIVVRKETAYQLRLSYRSTSTKLEPPPAEIVVDHGDSLQLLSIGPLLVQASADDFLVPLVTKRYAEDRYTSVRIGVRPVEGSIATTVLGPSVNLLMGLREARWFWTKVFVGLAVVAATTLVAGVKPADLGTASTPAEVGRALLAQVTWWRLAAAAIQAAVLFALLRMIGKRPV